MPKPGGTLATDSTQVEYPFGFAPIKALRRRYIKRSFTLFIFLILCRHWCVCFAGSGTVTIFWAITLLMSAVFTTSISRHIQHSNQTSTASLLPIVNQSRALKSGFLLAAYSHLGLQQDLRGFVDDESAMLPFTIDKGVGRDSMNETRTAPTIGYGSALSSKPAKCASRAKLS